MRQKIPKWLSKSELVKNLDPEEKDKKIFYPFGVIPYSTNINNLEDFKSVFKAVDFFSLKKIPISIYLFCLINKKAVVNYLSKHDDGFSKYFLEEINLNKIFFDKRDKIINYAVKNNISSSSLDLLEITVYNEIDITYEIKNDPIYIVTDDGFYQEIENKVLIFSYSINGTIIDDRYGTEKIVLSKYYTNTQYKVHGVQLFNNEDLEELKNFLSTDRNLRYTIYLGHIKIDINRNIIHVSFFSFQLIYNILTKDKFIDDLFKINKKFEQVVDDELPFSFKIDTDLNVYIENYFNLNDSGYEYIHNDVMIGIYTESDDLYP